MRGSLPARCTKALTARPEIATLFDCQRGLAETGKAFHSEFVQGARCIILDAGIPVGKMRTKSHLSEGISVLP